MSGDGSDLPIEEDPPRQDGTQYDIHDPGQWFGAVLLADEIMHYCTKGRMIHPFCKTRLRPASYQLTLGEKIHIGGKERTLKALEPTFLEPHQVAVVSTAETLKIPRFLIARWSLRVSNIYEGLLWTGGPQVDPGWNGPLYCPIYNLSEREVRLCAGDPFFTIDFIRTTALTDSYLALTRQDDTKETWFTAKRKTLADHDRFRIQSAPFEALQEVRDVREFRTTYNAVVAIMFMALAAVVAAISFISTRDMVDPGGDPFDSWFISVGAAAAASLLLSMGAVFLTWRIYSRLAQFQRRR